MWNRINGEGAKIVKFCIGIFNWILFHYFSLCFLFPYMFSIWKAIEDILSGGEVEPGQEFEATEKTVTQAHHPVPRFQKGGATRWRLAGEKRVDLICWPNMWLKLSWRCWKRFCVNSVCKYYFGIIFCHIIDNRAFNIEFCKFS